VRVEGDCRRARIVRLWNRNVMAVMDAVENFILSRDGDYYLTILKGGDDS